MNSINVLVKLTVSLTILKYLNLSRFIYLELLHKQQQIYIDPHIIEIPYYLCIKTSTFTNDIPSLQPRPHYTNKRDLNTGYGKKPLENEYWFSVPKEKYDVYSFLFSCAIVLYSSEKDFDSSDKIWNHSLQIESGVPCDLNTHISHCLSERTPPNKVINLVLLHIVPHISFGDS